MTLFVVRPESTDLGLINAMGDCITSLLKIAFLNGTSQNEVMDVAIAEDHALRFVLGRATLYQ